MGPGFHSDPSWHSGCCCLACRGMCILPGICIPSPWLAHNQTGHVKQYFKQLNIFRGFSSFHFTSLPYIQVKPTCLPDPALKTTGCQLWYSIALEGTGPWFHPLEALTSFPRVTACLPCISDHAEIQSKPFGNDMCWCAILYSLGMPQATSKDSDL